MKPLTLNADCSKLARLEYVKLSKSLADSVGSSLFHFVGGSSLSRLKDGSSSLSHWGAEGNRLHQGWVAKQMIEVGSIYQTHMALSLLPALSIN